MHSRRTTYWMALGLIAACRVWAAMPPPETLPADGTDLGPAFRAYARFKQAEVRQAATNLQLAVPEDVQAFFALVESNQWRRADRRYRDFDRRIGRLPYDEAPEAVLQPGLDDVDGLFTAMPTWDRDLMRIFIQEALRPIPDGSLLFCGADEARYFLLFGAEVLRPGRVTAITQNGLANDRYVEYVRAVKGNRVGLFSPQQARMAHDSYLESFTTEGGPNPRGRVEFKDGKPYISGIRGVMDVAGILTRKVFEANRSLRDCYVQESYVMPWMYPHLTPDGLLLKLHSDRVATLPPLTMKADQAYWAALEQRLMKRPAFATNEPARRTFAKCRSCIADVYAFHQKWAEAEAAHAQAVRLCPSSSEATLRYTDMLVQRREYARAIAVLTAFREVNTVATADDYVTRFLKRIEGLQAAQKSAEAP